MNEIVIFLGVANLVGLFLLWQYIRKRDDAHTELARLHAELTNRVIRIEEWKANGLSTGEVRAIFNELAEIRGRVTASVDLIHTIQKYMLEHDE